MKQIAMALAALLLIGGSPARAEEALLPAADVLARLPAALGKQVDVRFSEAFAKDRLLARDLDGLVVYELPPGKICLFGQGKGLEPTAPGLSAFASESGGGDVCVPLADVTLRYSPQLAPGAPPAPFYATDKTACRWVWKQGKGIGIWTEACTFESGAWDVVYDAEKDLFALRVDAGEPYTVLQQFHTGGGGAAVLPELKAKGLVLDDAECVMAQVADQPVPDGWTAYQVVPTGKRKAAFDSIVQVEIPEPPCGKLGYSVSSIGFFMTSEAHPGHLLYANLGQDGTMIDLASITFSP